jgi:hypothetical protein
LALRRPFRHEGGPARVAVIALSSRVIPRFLRLTRPAVVEGRTVCAEGQLRARAQDRHGPTSFDHEGLPPRFAGRIGRLRSGSVAACPAFAPVEAHLCLSDGVQL